MLARLWEGREATSIWIELVAERKRELEKVEQTEPGYEACWVASKISLSREQLAEWDASARAWLRTADEAMIVKQRQLMLMLEDIGLSVNSKPFLYQSVVHAWKSAMTATDNLIQGIPQSIQNGAVLLCLSSWHIYPDMLVLGEGPRTIGQDDHLVHDGGILTIGLHMENDKEDKGVFWSLPLAQLRYYGGPVLAERSLATQGDRISLIQLFQVVAGCLSRGWGADVLELGKLFMHLWEYVSSESWQYTEPGTSHWLGALSKAMEHLSSDDTVAHRICRQLMQFGQRRCANFMDPDGASQGVPKLFGILEAKTYFSLLRSPNDRVLAMRQFASTLPDVKRWAFVIRYVVNEGKRREFEYATAIPAKRDAYKRTTDDTCNLSEGNRRWVTTLVLQDGEYIFDSSRSESIEKLGEDTFPVEEEMIEGQDDYSFRWVRPPNPFAPTTESEFTDFAEVDLDTWEEGTQTFARRLDFQFVAGDVHSCALFTSGSRQKTNHKSQGDTLVPHDDFHKALETGLLRPKAVLRHLAEFLQDESRSNLLLSLRALATVANIYKLLPDATVSLRVTSQSLCDMPWIKTPPALPNNVLAFQSGSARAQPFSAVPMDWSRTFSCIALFESGSFSVQPASFRRVMAMSVADSLYIAAPLLCDPSENPSPFEIRRVRGNVGKPGIALLVPPETTRIHEPDYTDWVYATHGAHATFDGKLEDSFSTTSLHLSFTGYTLPVDVGTYGCQDSEMYFLESLVSVHDKRNWVADLDILHHLHDERFRRLETSCAHVSTARNPNHSVIQNPKLTMIDHWNEVLDRSTSAAIVRSTGNWLGRLATTTFSLQMGYPTLAVSKGFCWECVRELWDNWRPDLTSQHNPDGHPDDVALPAIINTNSYELTEKQLKERTDFEKKIQSELEGFNQNERNVVDILDEMHGLVIIC